MSLGYIGLILIIFEGGLSVRLDLLKKNFLLSLVGATIGVVFPIGLCYCLLYLGFGFGKLIFPKICLFHIENFLSVILLLLSSVPPCLFPVPPSTKQKPHTCVYISIYIYIYVLYVYMSQNTVEKETEKSKRGGGGGGSSKARHERERLGGLNRP